MAAVEIAEVSSLESIAAEFDKLYLGLPPAVKGQYRYKSTTIGLLENDKGQRALEVITKIHDTYQKKKMRAKIAARVKSAKLRDLKAADAARAAEPKPAEIAEPTEEEEIIVLEPHEEIIVLKPPVEQDEAPAEAPPAVDEPEDESNDDKSEDEPEDELVPVNKINVRDMLKRSTNQLPQPKKAVAPKRVQRRQVSGSNLFA